MTIKVGIVGARGLSTVMGFNNIPEARVEALCDLDEQLLREQAQKYNIPKTYRVYDDMLENMVNKGLFGDVYFGDEGGYYDE